MTAATTDAGAVPEIDGVQSIADTHWESAGVGPISEWAASRSGTYVEEGGGVAAAADRSET